MQRLERQGSNREINATSVHYDYYVGEGQTKTIRRFLEIFVFACAHHTSPALHIQRLIANHCGTSGALFQNYL